MYIGFINFQMYFKSTFFFFNENHLLYQLFVHTLISQVNRNLELDFMVSKFQGHYTSLDCSDNLHKIQYIPKKVFNKK